MNDVFKTIIYDMQTVTMNVKQCLQSQLLKLELDITFEMVRVLTILSYLKYANQQQLADLTLKNKASLTSLIDNLVKRDLVTRSEDTADRRNKIITITSKGKEYMKKVNPLVETFFDNLSKEFNSEEIALLKKSILKMNEFIKR